MRLIGPILRDADHLVVPLVASLIPNIKHRGFGPCVSAGIMYRDNLIGGAVFHGYDDFAHAIMVSIAVAKRVPWAKSEVLKALFEIPFVELGCVRLEATTGRKNKAARKFLVSLGFVLEGVHPKRYDGRQDVISYGMLKHQCRWLKEGEHG